MVVMIHVRYPALIMIDFNMKKDYNLCLFSHLVFLFWFILHQILKCHVPPQLFPLSIDSSFLRLVFLVKDIFYALLKTGNILYAIQRTVQEILELRQYKNRSQTVYYRSQKQSAL